MTAAGTHHQERTPKSHLHTELPWEGALPWEPGTMVRIKPLDALAYRRCFRDRLTCLLRPHHETAPRAEREQKHDSRSRNRRADKAQKALETGPQ